MVIALKFLGPDGKVGFTDARNYHEAVKTAKVYMADGYQLIDHFLWEE